jgi:geranylgeranyl diphosphate synthase type I
MDAVPVADVTGTVPRLRPAPPSLAAIGDRVMDRIDALLTAERARWVDVDADLGDPIDALADFVRAGGKRLRPALCHWAYIGAGGADIAASTDAGAALELLHTFALVHDDVMDDSPTRRGAPTVHARFVDRHAAEGWRGESRRFGESVAILVGDLAFVYADVLATGLDDVAMRVFAELRIEVNVGQYLDVRAGVDRGYLRDRARRISVLKSGKYTVERPLHLGAALAGRLDPLAADLSAYGLPLGEAFQLRDDLLGAFGEELLLGKPVGADLREGKATELLAAAREAASPAALEVLDRVGAADLSDDDVRRVQDVLVDTGARDAMEARVLELTGRAVASLETVDLVAPAKDELIALAHYIADRDS